MLLAGTALVAASPALAQSTWNGATSDYNLDANWSPPTAPVVPGQSAIFDTTGVATVTVTAPVNPTSWTFTVASQSYTLTGAAVTFSGFSDDSFGIINNANSGQTISIANNIGNSSNVGATVQQLGNSMLILLGNNTYTGGTVITAGTLSLGNNSALGADALTAAGGTVDYQNGIAINNTVDLSAATNFNVATGATATQSGQIINSGDPTGFNKTGGGLLALSGTNTYGGATLIAGGTLRADSDTALPTLTAVTVSQSATLQISVNVTSNIGSLAGAGNVSIGSGAGLLVGNDSSITTFSGQMSGLGSLAMVGPGSLTLTGTGSSIGGDLSVLGGALTISGGSFSNGGQALIFGGTLAVTDGGTLTTQGPGSVSQFATTPVPDPTVPNVLISGAGSSWTVAGGLSIGGFGGTGGPGIVTVADGGVLTSGMTGSLLTTQVNAGSTLNIGNGGLAGTVNTSQITLNGATSAVVANFTNTSTVSAPIIGDGSLTKQGAGTLILTGDSSYAGGTMISGGTLQLGNGGSTGSIGGDITNNGVLAVNRAANTTLNLDGVISGTGSVHQAGPGITLLNAASTYSGGTVISGGVLVVNNSTPGVSSSAGTGRVTLDGGTFQAGADGLTFSNTFAVNTTGGTVDTNGAVLTLSGVIADGNGPGALTVTGGGILTLTAANTYSDGTTNSGGFLSLGDATHTASIRGPVTNNGNFDVFNADVSGVTQITNTGFVTFFNANSSASTHIDNNGGTTTFLDTSTAGTATILNRNGGITRFGISGGTDTATAGSVNITNQDMGSATVFVAQTTAGQATILNTTGAVTSFGEHSSAGAATITNRNGGATAFSDNASASSATIVNRDGSFDAPSGTVFSGSSTAGTATITNLTGGFTGFIGNASAASATIVNRDGTEDLPSTTLFAGSSTAGNATITNQNLGVVIFSEQSSGANATIINNRDGGAAFGAMPGDTTSAGNAFITNNDGGATAFNQFSTAGNATITTNAGGATLFTNNSTGGNAQFITNAGGVVDFSATTGPAGDGRITAGSIAGAGNYYLGGNRLTVGGNNLSTEVSGTINDGEGPVPCECGAGNGTGASLVKVGSGTLILSGTNTYTGGTMITNGILQIGNGGTTGSILGNVLDNSILAFNRSNTYSFDGVISGTGAFRQDGAGRTILTATSTYTGTTTVNAGTLSVNGSIATSSGVDVNNGGTIGGSGILPTTRVNAGGSLAPGNSIGTITIAGNLAFVGAGNYVVEVSQTAADRTNVTGTAALAGTLRAVPIGTFTSATRYTVLNATGGVTGRFGSADFASFGVLIRPSVSYDANDVFLDLGINTISSVLTNGAVNQRNVGTALDAGFAGGNVPASFVPLFGLSASALPAALTQLSGEIGSGAARASQQDMGQFLELMLDPFLENRVSGAGVGFGGPALSFAPEQAHAGAPEGLMAYGRMVTKAPPAVLYDPRWTTWGAAFGATGSFDGNATTGSHDLTTRSGGFAGGIDYRFSPSTVVGFAASGSSLSYNLDSGLGSGRGDVFKAGLYASTRMDNAYLSVSAAYGAYDLNTNRNVFLPGFGDRLTADFSAHSFGGRVETGYRFAWMGTSGITPYAAFQAQSFHTPSYSEADATGLAGFALTYGANSTTESHSELGMRFDSRFALADNAILLLRGRLGWAHQFSDDSSINALFQTLPGAGFTVTGAGLSRDSLLVSIGPEMKLANGWSLRAKFDGAFGDQSQIYAGTGTLRYTW